MIKTRVCRGVLCILAAVQFAFAYGLEDVAQAETQNAAAVVFSAGDSSGVASEQRTPKSVASGLYMTGNWSASWSGSSVTIKLDGINNDSTTRTSGSLRLELWAATGSTAPARGSTNWTGYKLATDASLSVMPPRTQYTNLVRTTTFTPPPNGTYWLMILMTEFDSVNCPAGDHYCTQDSVPSSTQSTFPTPDYSGAWSNGSEGGWGLSIVRGPNSGLYGIIMYHYNQSASPTWYWMSGGSFFGNVYSAPVTLYSGPYFGGSYNTSQVAAPTVGSVSINFTSATTGVMTYTINGATVSNKSIAKLIF